MNKKTLYQNSILFVVVGIIVYLMLEYGFDVDDALIQAVSMVVIAVGGMWLFAWYSSNPSAPREVVGVVISLGLVWLISLFTGGFLWMAGVIIFGEAVFLLVRYLRSRLAH